MFLRGIDHEAKTIDFRYRPFFAWRVYGKCRSLVLPWRPSCLWYGFRHHVAGQCESAAVPKVRSRFLYPAGWLNGLGYSKRLHCSNEWLCLWFRLAWHPHLSPRKSSTPRQKGPYRHLQAPGPKFPWHTIFLFLYLLHPKASSYQFNIRKFRKIYNITSGIHRARLE